MADVTSSREPCAINPQSLGLLTLGLHTGGRGRRGWVNWKVGIDVYSLPQRNRKLLYGAGSSAQCSVTTWRDGTGGEEGRPRRAGTRVCRWLVDFRV